MKREHEDEDERFIGTYRKDIRAVCLLIRSCYAVSARDAERLLRQNNCDLELTLDELGESTDEPAFTQHDSIERAGGTTQRSNR